MSAAVITKFLSEEEYEPWRDFVVSSPQGTIYSLPEYLETLCQAVGGRFRILVAEQQDEIVGGIALYERPSRFGVWVDTRLLLFYNGLVLRDYSTRYPSQLTSRHLKILSALEEQLSETGYVSLQLKNHSSLSDVRVFQQRGWHVKPTYTYVVRIDDPDATWNRIEQNLRRLSKRCQKQGMQFTDDDDFDSYYRMHVQTHERKGAPLYMPQHDYQRFFERLKSLGLCRLYHARTADGASVSAQLVLTGPCAMSHTVSAAADEDHLNSGATAYLRWKAFEHLSGLGYTSNDLTDASLNPVTRFKSQLGGDLAMCLVLRRPETRVYRFSRSFERYLYGRKQILVSRVKKILNISGHG